MAQLCNLENNGLGSVTMDPNRGRETMGDGTGCRNTPVDELERDGHGMERRLQPEASEDGGVQEACGGARIDQRMDWDRRLAGWAEVDQNRKVRRGGGGERRGERRRKRVSTAQPGSYWLGRAFFDPSACAKWAAAAAAEAGAVASVQGPGKEPGGAPRVGITGGAPRNG